MLWVQNSVEPCLGPEPLDYFSGKALGPRSLFSLFFGNYGALYKNKGIWILFRKNVTYKQIALENLCLTLGAWVRRRESHTLPLLSNWRPPPLSSLCVVSGHPKGSTSFPRFFLPCCSGPPSCSAGDVLPLPACKSLILLWDPTSAFRPKFWFPSDSSFLLCSVALDNLKC